MSLWYRLWATWAIVGLGSAVALIAAQELGVAVPARVWWWWAIPGVVGGGTLELWALRDALEGNTLSEITWGFDRGVKSFVSAVVLWLAWWLATGDAWPSAGIAFMLWFVWHVRFDGPRRRS